MKETVEKATLADLPELVGLYDEARAFMKANGNPTQWGVTGYPQEDVLLEDIELSRLYVIRRGGSIAGAFVLAEGEEPTYRVIEEGAWPSDKPYLTIHRLASKTSEHGIGKTVLDFCRAEAIKKGLDLRADTHADNLPVQHILTKYGFMYCGVIRVRYGSKRLAYQLELK